MAKKPTVESITETLTNLQRMDFKPKFQLKPLKDWSHRAKKNGLWVENVNRQLKSLAAALQNLETDRRRAISQLKNALKKLTKVEKSAKQR